MTQLQRYPFSQFRGQLAADTARIDKDKATHEQVRGWLSQEEATVLDQQFKITFEKLEAFFSGRHTGDINNIHRELKNLTDKGASAVLLGTDELGTYNLAMLIKEIGHMPAAILPVVKDIIRISITAGADISGQKAYVGNGGSVALEWLIIYLGGGIGTPGLYLTSREQYQCCYDIFPWFINRETTDQYSFEVFEMFLRDLRPSPEVQDMQEMTILRMMDLGYLPFDTREYYVSAAYFRRIALLNMHWLTLIFPYEDPQILPYLENLRSNINEHVIECLLNAFTSNQKRRKHFRAYFLQRPHWLLQQIIHTSPAIIFDLVRRNEQDMLMPFLKYYKKELAALRDANNFSLLQWAQQVRGVVPATIALLLQANL
ncbi:hypothetical protein [Chitinophaga sp. Cy-1792]|uniref:hypothetical protein n=1 Tax=Chitinophaga sp. Cy-1792 TaxID=2608339 RepID=UPI00141EEFBD|nr:hypothetical protein [Chitinophaga sp. Cy-1792]NIG55082.1 hypothetical protein [Chitinophaga sp. Cy-1792]